MRLLSIHFHRSFAVASLLALGIQAGCRAEGPPPSALASFRRYTAAVEGNLARQHRTAEGFLPIATDPESRRRLLAGEFLIEPVKAPAGPAWAGAMLHDWRGAAFAPGATTAEFETLLRQVNAYPRIFAPQVTAAHVLAGTGDAFRMTMRVQQRHVLEVVMDTTYDVVLGQLDPEHGYSASRSTRIAEIEGAGTGHERALSPGEEHGFLWRIDTFWAFEERDGGLYLQIESVSLTASVPRGLGWAIGPYVESIPRDSLQFTLRSVCRALRRPSH